MTDNFYTLIAVVSTCDNWHFIIALDKIVTVIFLNSMSKLDQQQLSNLSSDMKKYCTKQKRSIKIQ